MITDTRVVHAREYLAAVRPHKVSQRPHNVLVREAAELRKFLGRVLDYAGQLDADRPEILGALDHAEQLMRERAAAGCEACNTVPGDPCDTCLEGLDQADAYAALAARLGGAS